MRLTLSNIATSLICFLTAITLGSCSLIYEDREGCPEGLYVRFVYDYNTAGQDLFQDHVGHIQLYVFDEKGNLAAQRSVSNTPDDSPLKQYGYNIHLSQSELPAGHRYRLQAVGMQRDWDEALSFGGAKYRHTASPTDNSENMMISLDHDSEPIPGTNQFAVDASAPLDTLWHTLKVNPGTPRDGVIVPAPEPTSAPYSIYPLEEQMAEVKDEHATYATISLIRNTKHLNLTLRHVGTPEYVLSDAYDVRIIDNNAHFSHDNSVLTHDSLRYTPYTFRPSRAETDNSVDPKAEYDIMFNRLIINPDDSQDNAMLEIYNRQNGKMVSRINLPAILSQGRQAYPLKNYGLQEYLDREHDYNLDIYLKDDDWIMVELHVLSWSKRIQNINI